MSVVAEHSAGYELEPCLSKKAVAARHRSLAVAAQALRRRGLYHPSMKSKIFNPLSAPAWSLDRIRIDYRAGGARRFALISAQRQADFLTALQERVPLDVSGSELVRRS